MDVHVSIDFNDDLWFASQAWDEEKLRGLIGAYAERGIRGIHWLDQGGIDDGIHDKNGYIDRLGTAWDFIRRVPDPLRVVADEAHRHGMQVYSVLKCFDLCCGMPWCTRPAGYRHEPPVGLPLVGGEGVLAHRWIREHPEMRAELHPTLQERTERRPIRKIRLWHESADLKGGEFQLFISENNRDYQSVAMHLAITCQEHNRRPPVFVPAPDKAFGAESAFTCFEFTDLNIGAPFIAVTYSGPKPIANTLAALVEIEDSAGERVPFTFGLGPVRTPQERAPDWRSAGIAFDAAFNTPIPGRGWTMTESGGRHRIELGPQSFLGLARGRNKHLSGVIELAYPQARQWLTAMASRAVDAGCDGVDIRMTTHTESLDWENYGFGAPVVEEFLRRHGVDIRTQPFDRAKWRRLRGSYVEMLLDETRSMLHAKGKKLSFQMSKLYDRPAEELCFHEIHFDWRKWCDEHIFDIANFVNFTFRESFYGEAVSRCRAAGIPMMMTPSMHSATDEDWARDAVELFDRCLQDGIDVFNIYESAAVVRLQQHGFEFLSPTLWKLVNQYRRHNSATVS